MSNTPIMTEARRTRMLTSHPTPQPREPLTPREQEIVARIATGKTNSEIAAALHVEVKTVKVHKTHIARKFNVATRKLGAVVTRYAMEEMVMAPPPAHAVPARRTPFPMRFLMLDADRMEAVARLIEGPRKGDRRRRSGTSGAGQRARMVRQAIAAYADLDASHRALEDECAALRAEIERANPYRDES